MKVFIRVASGCSARILAERCLTRRMEGFYSRRRFYTGRIARRFFRSG